MNKKLITSYLTTISYDLFNNAKKEFGVSNDFSKGVWLLPDGSLLNLGSGKGRLSHSDVIKIFPKELLEQDPSNYIGEEQYVREMFLKAGAIRLSPEGGGIEISKSPTENQYAMIAKYFSWIKYSEFYIDLSGKGSPIKKMYENNPEERSVAMNTIYSYFKGKLQNPSLVQQFRYSDEKRRQVIKVK